MRFLVVLAYFLYSGVIQANPIKALVQINYSAFSSKQINKDLIQRHELGFTEQDIVVNVNISPNQKIETVSVNGSENLLGATKQIYFKKILEKRFFTLGHRGKRR